MMPTLFRSLPASLALLILCPLLGCGTSGSGSSGTSPTPTLTPGTIADLRGGWLIAGTLPQIGPGVLPTPTSFGLSMTLDVISGKLTGTAAILVPCALGGAFTGAVGGGTEVATAEVAADGTFVLQDVLLGSATQHQFVVNGKLPATAGGVWSGTYTAGAPYAGCNGVVPPSVSGSYTTQKMEPLTGTFSASGTLGTSSTPVTIAAGLQQGGPDSLNVLGARVTSVNAVEGTVQITGSSCFKTGSIQNNHGAVFGNAVQLEFTMDDGSTLLLNGSVGDLAASSIKFASVAVLGGACNNMSGFTGATLQKQ